MPAFVWTGKTREGTSVSGDRVGDNKAALENARAVRRALEEKGREIKGLSA